MSGETADASGSVAGSESTTSSGAVDGPGVETGVDALGSSTVAVCSDTASNPCEITSMFDISPHRSAYDILFVIDNSPSMAAERENLARNFPAMLATLKDLPYGLPDLHVAVVNSDFGAGPASCNGLPALGDRGLMWGRPSDDLVALVNVDLRAPAPSIPGCGLNPGARWIENFLIPKSKNFTGDIVDVFACLADVGTMGCHYEQPLQALRAALSAATTPANVGFLRKDAYLAVILVSDEDDCSADPSSDLFTAPLREGETPSLRCATRGHACGGAPIPYYTPEQGFAPPDSEAQIGFEASLQDCAPRSDSASPLIPVQTFVDEVKALKERPEEQIVVSGIFGWPLAGQEEGAKYQIGRNPDPAEAEGANLWDYLPVCEKPGLGRASAGLRLKQFVDAFNGGTFPICEDDFGKAIDGIGDQIAMKAMTPGCVDYWLADGDGDLENGVQPQCRVADLVPRTDGTGYDEHQLQPCSDAASPPCWRLVRDAVDCPMTGQRVMVARPLDPDTDAPELVWPGTQLSVKCMVCPSDPAVCSSKG